MWLVKCCVLHGNVNIACHIGCIRAHEFWTCYLATRGGFINHFIYKMFSECCCDFLELLRTLSILATLGKSFHTENVKQNFTLDNRDMHNIVCLREYFRFNGHCFLQMSVLLFFWLTGWLLLVYHLRQENIGQLATSKFS